MRFARFAALIALTAIAGCGSGAAVEIDSVWARATPPGSTVGSVYARVSATSADEIVGVDTPAAERVEIHATTEHAGTMQMRPVTTVALPANEVVEFKAGGLHLMLIGLRAPLAAGSAFPITFNFRSAAPITMQAKVIAPGDDHTGH